MMNSKKSAFTLAEVLITLGVIGVVAAITMPTVIANINERVNSERQANIAQKITQAMEQMRAHGLLNTQYASTDAFVDELQKYLKIAKRCDSEHIADCWPTDKVTTADGKEFEVNKAKTGKNLSLSTESSNVGLILVDGAAIILNYNPETKTIDVGDRVKGEFKDLQMGNGKTKRFAYTTDVTSGVDFVMDVNGGKKPNSEVEGKSRDIRSFKSAQFSKGGPDCTKYANSFYVEDVGCVVKVGTGYQAETSASNSTCIAAHYCSNDYWVGAQNKCNSLNNMHLTSRDELNNLFKRSCQSNNNPDYDSATCISDIPTSDGFWSSVEYDTDEAWYEAFPNGTEHFYYKTRQYGALCVGN
ncbi:prepilin-type N-terminal cleavage/methylation domain-containing protein [bacterium]|nr:prepilin-type N-terminal cleavage/methylation domain-containing protein [bacterium]